MEPLARSRLRDDIVGRLASLICSGELACERLKEVELAAQLGVSRTPLREALLILEREGLVVSEVNKGFRLAALSEAKVRELYPILGALEGLAVKESGERLRARVGELRAVNAALRASRTKERRHALDHRFHELLRDACPNRSVVELVRRLWLQAQRFDGATDRGMAEPVGSLRDHVAITDAIGRGDFAGAAARIDEHWWHGIDIVVRWLRARAARASSSATARTASSAVLAAVALGVALGGAACGAPRAPEPALPDAEWGYFVDEAAVSQLVERWSQAHRPRTTVIQHVAVVSMARPGVELDQTVVIEDGKIAAIGPAAQVRLPAGASGSAASAVGTSTSSATGTRSSTSTRSATGASSSTGTSSGGDVLVIDGRGKYAMPGLVDMHTHSNLSDAQYILDLANGVTSIREMDGHPFLLRQRAAARDGRLLAPNLYVAGKILASRPLSWYATVVTTPDAARAAIRDQQAAGYEFIKVHNIVLPEVYDAICAEARAQGLDVVGHIPHATTIARAIACGQRTFEHFKSYINDRDLTLTTEDYVAATRGAEVWNTPTFYNHRTHLRGDEARALLTNAPEMRYVPARDRARWRALADEPPKPVQQNVLPMSERIFRDLVAAGGRFLAGTDSGGGYPYHVPGFSLHEELAIMARNGMAVPDVLRTATVEPAIAMRRERELGTLEVGKRADLVLLSRDPRAAIGNLAAIDGVMVRGTWLPRAALDDMLAALAAIARGRDRPLRRADLDRALDTLEQLRARGYILRDHMLGWLRHRLEAARLPVDRPLFDGIAALAPDED